MISHDLLVQMAYYVPKEDYKPLSETGKIERHRNYHLHVLNLIPADIIK